MMSPGGSPGAMKAIAVWGLVFKTRQYLKGSLWFLPLLGGIAGAVLGAAAASSDRTVGVLSSLEYSASTAEAVLAAIVGSTAALTGFVVTVSVLVVQMATSTFSARYMRLWYRDRMLHVLLAMLVGTFTFSFTLLAGVEENSVPNLGVTASGALVAVDMFLFLFFLDRFVHRLRPVAVAALVAEAGRRAFESVVVAASGPGAPDIVRAPVELDHPSFVVRTHRAGSIQAVHAAGLVRFAREHDCTLVLNHVVGDFVPAGAPVIQVYGSNADGRRFERRLRGMFALGVERTIEQDPAFALRIMVDIAIKALSPAVNDPTTAVQVINHLGDTLNTIGATNFEPNVAPVQRPWRVVVSARGWEEYLSLGVTEIREYGASSVQVVRRLRAVLTELHDAVRPEHRAAVESELARLDAEVEREFGSSPDLDRASEPDRQGLGGVNGLGGRSALERTLR
jgi:uncharacterized membrane protein